jgi:hypothetical protein
MAQVVECLPSKRKALSSNHSTTKKKSFIFNVGQSMLPSLVGKEKPI